MATKKSVKKNTRKRGRRYLKKTVRRTIAALLMVTALIVAAIPATPTRAKIIDPSGIDSDYIQFIDNGYDSAAGHGNGYFYYFSKIMGTPNIAFVGFTQVIYTKGTASDPDSGALHIEVLPQEQTKDASITIDAGDFSVYLTESINLSDLESSPTENIVCTDIGKRRDSVEPPTDSDIKNADKIVKMTCKGVNSINDGAFKNARKLNAFFGDSVNYVGNSAFDGCGNLDDNTLSSSLSTVGDYAFQNCTTLTEFPIKYDAPLEYLGAYAFAGCTGLSGIIKIPATEQGDETVIGNLSVHDGAFKGCNGISRVEIHDNYRTLGADVFNGCSSLAEIKLPANLKKVKERAFESCEALDVVEIPKGISSLPESIFISCPSLTDVYFYNDGVDGRDIQLDKNLEYFPKNMDGKYELTVHGFHYVQPGAGGSAGNPTSAFNYCYGKNINYSCIEATVKHLDGSETYYPYDGGSAGDYFSIEKDGTLTGFNCEKYLENDPSGELTIPESILGIPVNKISSDLFTNNHRIADDRYISTITVDCKKGCQVEAGAFYLDNDNGLKWVKFNDNNIHLEEASSLNQWKPMFPTQPDFYIQGKIVVDPSKAAPMYSWSDRKMTGIIAQDDDDDETCNAYVFAMNNTFDGINPSPYMFKGSSDNEDETLTLVIKRDYTLSGVEGSNNENAITLPTGVLFIDGCIWEELSDEDKEKRDPDTIQKVKEGVFYNSDVSSFNAKGLLDIRDYQFANCKSLSKVNLPNTIQSFGMLPFYGCEKLYDSGLTFEEDGYFTKDSSYPIIYGPNDSSRINKGKPVIYEALENKDSGSANVSSEGETYIVPSTITAIKKRAFTNNNWVRTFDNSDSGLNEIPEYCFDKANKLINVFLGAKKLYVNQGALNYNLSNGTKTLNITCNNAASTYAHDNMFGALWINHDPNNTGDNRHRLSGMVEADDPKDSKDPDKADEDNLYQQYYYNSDFLQYDGKATGKKKLNDPSKVSISWNKVQSNGNGIIEFDEDQLPASYKGTYTIQNIEDPSHPYGLNEGEDYVLSFTPSVNWDSPVEGDYTVTFTGRKSYSSDPIDSVTKGFHLQPSSILDKIPITDTKINVGDPIKYKGNSVTFKNGDGGQYSIKYNGEYLIDGEDYYYELDPFDALTNPSDGEKVKVVFHGKGNYTGESEEYYFYLEDTDTPPQPENKLENNYEIKPSQTLEAKYTGSGITVTAVGTDKGTPPYFYIQKKGSSGTNDILDPSSDYTWVYDGVNKQEPKVGDPNGDTTYAFTVTGKAGTDHEGTLSGSFTIKVDSSSSSSTPSGSSTSSSSGPGPGPGPSSSSSGQTTLSVNLILNGPDRSAVSKETYKATNNFQYWNEGDPGIKSIVDRNGNALSEGTDYTIQSYGTVRPGIGKNTGYVQIQFKGNYSSEGRQNFYYDVKKDLSKNTSDDGVKSVTIQVSEATIDSSDKIEATVALTDSTTGTDLAKDTDYLQGSYKKTSDHHADVKVTGKGDKYVGTYTYNFRMEEKKSSSSSGKSSSSSSKGSSSSAKSSSSSSGTGGSSSSGGGSGGSGNNNSGTTVVNRNYYNSGNGGSVDELQDMLKAAHIDSINGGTADGYQVNITKSDAAEAAFREALLRRYGSLDNIRYFSMDIDVKDENGNDIDTTGMSVTLTLPLPGSMEAYGTNNKVATVDGNGDLEDLNVQFSTLEGRPCATFVAPHFSPYGFYVNTGDLAIGTLDNTPKTADPISPKWFISLGLAALSIFLFLKKDPKPRANAA